MKKAEKIHYELQGRADEIGDIMLVLIAEALAPLPDSVINYVVDSVTFRQGNSFTPKDYILSGGIIFLDSSLNNEEKEKAICTVQHEVAHALLKHKIRVDENEKQENEADNLVMEWLKT